MQCKTQRAHCEPVIGCAPDTSAQQVAAVLEQCNLILSNLFLYKLILPHLI